MIKQDMKLPKRCPGRFTFDTRLVQALLQKGRTLHEMGRENPINEVHEEGKYQCPWRGRIILRLRRNPRNKNEEKGMIQFIVIMGQPDDWEGTLLL